MKELWRMVGYACIDNAFCVELGQKASLAKAEEGRKEFYSFVVKQNKFLLSKWERDQIVKIFTEAELCAQINQIWCQIHSCKPTFKNREMIYTLIGLICLDRNSAAEYRKAATKDEKALRRAIPFDDLDKDELTFLCRILNDEKASVLMQAYSDNSWSRTGIKGACDWALSDI